jgi:hypothetical protein
MPVLWDLIFYGWKYEYVLPWRDGTTRGAPCRYEVPDDTVLTGGQPFLNQHPSLQLRICVHVNVDHLRNNGTVHTGSVVPCIIGFAPCFPQPTFQQLYFYDPAGELENRMKVWQAVSYCNSKLSRRLWIYGNAETIQIALHCINPRTKSQRADRCNWIS